MSSVILHTSQFGSFRNCANTSWSPFGIHRSICPTDGGLVGTQVSTRIRYKRKEVLFSQLGPLLASFRLGSVFVTRTCVVFHQTFIKINSSHLCTISSTSVLGTGFLLAGSSLADGVTFLLGDRDERDEIVGTARNGLLAFLYSGAFFLAKGRLSLIQSDCRPKDCAHGKSSTNFTFKQVPSSWMQTLASFVEWMVRFFFPAVRETSSPSYARKHHCRQCTSLSFGFMIGLESSSAGEKPLKNFALFTSPKSLFLCLQVRTVGVLPQSFCVTFRNGVRPSMGRPARRKLTNGLTCWVWFPSGA